MSCPKCKRKFSTVPEKTCKLCGEKFCQLCCTNRTAPKLGYPKEIRVCPPCVSLYKMDCLLSPQSGPDQGKLTLVLDLDETMSHTNQESTKGADFTISLTWEHKIWVKKRPHLDAFLERVCQIFEVVVWTAAPKEVAQQVLDRIDTRKGFRGRLFREACTMHGSDRVKDLVKLGRDLDSVIIVDDSPHSYKLQPQCALPIKKFINDMDDIELPRLLSQLEMLNTTAWNKDYFVKARQALQQHRSRGIYGPLSVADNEWIKAVQVPVMRELAKAQQGGGMPRGPPRGPPGRPQQMMQPGGPQGQGMQPPGPGMQQPGPGMHKGGGGMHPAMYGTGGAYGPDGRVYPPPQQQQQQQQDWQQPVPHNSPPHGRAPQPQQPSQQQQQAWQARQQEQQQRQAEWRQRQQAQQQRHAEWRQQQQQQQQQQQFQQQQQQMQMQGQVQRQPSQEQPWQQGQAPQQQQQQPSHWQQQQQQQQPPQQPPRGSYPQQSWPQQPQQPQQQQPQSMPTQPAVPTQQPPSQHSQWQQQHAASLAAEARNALQAAQANAAEPSGPAGGRTQFAQMGAQWNVNGAAQQQEWQQPAQQPPAQQPPPAQYQPWQQPEEQPQHQDWQQQQWQQPQQPQPSHDWPQQQPQQQQSVVENPMWQSAPGGNMQPTGETEEDKLDPSVEQTLRSAAEQVVAHATAMQQMQQAQQKQHRQLERKRQQRLHQEKILQQQQQQASIPEDTVSRAPSNKIAEMQQRLLMQTNPDNALQNAALSGKTTATTSADSDYVEPDQNQQQQWQQQQWQQQQQQQQQAQQQQQWSQQQPQQQQWDNTAWGAPSAAEPWAQQAGGRVVGQQFAV